MTKRQNILGRYLGVLEVSTAFQDAKTKEASVIMVVQYEHIQASARMDFIRFEDSWKLLGYALNTNHSDPIQARQRLGGLLRFYHRLAT